MALLPFQRKVCCGFLLPLKNPLPLLGLNLWTKGPMASTLTITPLRRLIWWRHTSNTICDKSRKLLLPAATTAPEHVMKAYKGSRHKVPNTTSTLKCWINRQRDQISACRPATLSDFFVVSSVAPSKCRDITLKIGHNCFLPYPFQFIICLSPFIQYYIFWVTEKASLKRKTQRSGVSFTQ
jgi:hypothetical protein